MKGRIVSWLWVIAGAVLISRSVSNVYRLWKSGGRVTEAQEQLASLEKEKEGLSRQLDQLQTPEYMERLVREKLGYGKPGEVVVVITEEKIENGELRIENENVPNWKQWRKLYLGF